MQCPIDNNTLVMSERNGIEIDYCPQCRGVWLDRGELDKIIERAEAPAPAAPAAPAAAPGYSEPAYAPQGYPAPGYSAPQYQEPRYNEPRYDDRNNGHYGKKKKRENWLSELFD